MNEEEKKFMENIVKLLQHAMNESPYRTSDHCPSCNTSIKDIQNTGKLGCPKCYEYFQEDLEDILLVAQNENKHKGKKPSKSLSYLEEEMKKAIKKENYIRAAEIRDKIKELG